MTGDSLSEMQALFRAAGVELAPEDWAFFERLRLAVVAANATMNLTRLTGQQDFHLKHVLDSALPFFVVPELKALGEGMLVADVGSGAGFPGFVLARLRPSWDVALIERTEKKAAFLEETAAAMDLDNVFVVPFDAQEAAAQVELIDHACDVVVARAVGPIAEVTRRSRKLLKKGGLLVHYKGGAPDAAELAEGRKAARDCGMEFREPLAYDLPPDARRSVVLCVSRSGGPARGGGRRPTRTRRGSRGRRAG